MRVRNICAAILAGALVTAGSWGLAGATSADGDTSSQAASPRTGTLARTELGSPVQPVVYALRSVHQGDLTLRLPEKVEQGGVLLVRVRVNGPLAAGKKLEILRNGKRVCVATLHPAPGTAQGSGEALALVPVPLDASSDKALWVEARLGGRSAGAAVPVAAVDWPRQKLTVSQKYVDPPQAVMEQIKRDRERVKAALGRVSPERSWALPLVRPLPGGVSSSFGGKRMFNGQMRSYHRGVDLRGAMGTPVRSVAAGTVLLAEEQYFSGNIVFVDHGQGLVTLYCHLSAIHVKPGDAIKAGQELGLVGATGRVTGPHLHLGALVGGQPVNPLALLALE